MTDEKQHIGSLFDRIAGTYDGLNHGLPLNIDRLLPGCFRGLLVLDRAQGIEPSLELVSEAAVNYAP